jgi:predicted RNase H-like HicB family nuclease
MRYEVQFTKIQVKSFKTIVEGSSEEDARQNAKELIFTINFDHVDTINENRFVQDIEKERLV